MVKRLLSAQASEIIKMTPQELKQSILASEGRIICSENVVLAPPLSSGLTNAEVASAYGADLILLNMFNCDKPIVLGLDEIPFSLEGITLTESKDPIHRLKHLVGRPIGVNLEPVDETATKMDEGFILPEGHRATARTLRKASELGFDFVCLTGNPGTGVTNKKITEAIKSAKENFTGLIIAGKMHSSGINEPVMSLESARDFIEAGADILLVPAVGTVPGFTDQELIDIVKYAKKENTLVMSAMGTSQEGSDVDTIRQIALRNKIAGVDIQHIGDAGYVGGIANVENIYALSITIRGIRHTINRVARSINR